MAWLWGERMQHIIGGRGQGCGQGNQTGHGHGHNYGCSHSHDYSGEQSENKEPSDGEYEDSDDIGGEEVMNLQLAQFEADHSLLREEVENITNSTSPDDINLEKVLQPVVVDSSRDSYDNLN
eukprot:12246029-Ditylum_brightwellii.AAC.1